MKLNLIVGGLGFALMLIFLAGYVNSSKPHISVGIIGAILVLAFIASFFEKPLKPKNEPPKVPVKPKSKPRIKPLGSAGITPTKPAVLANLGRFKKEHLHPRYPDVIAYKELYDTPFEKYIPEMEKRYAELLKDDSGVEKQTMSIKYAQGGKKLEFVMHVKLKPNWHNKEGKNEYDYVCLSYNPPDNLYEYGAYQSYQYYEFKDKLAFDSKQRLVMDNAYAEVIVAALKICDTTNYNWAAFSEYKGAKPKPVPGKRLEVCAGYANIGEKEFIKLDCVESVETWSTTKGSHAWNVINLVDGRRIYADVTWFNNDYINEKTGKTLYRDDYGWANITFDENLFNHSGLGYGSKMFTHAASDKIMVSHVDKKTS